MTKVEKINSRIIAALEANGIERYRIAGEVRRNKLEKVIQLFDYVSHNKWNPFVFDDKYDVTVFHLAVSGDYDLSKDLNQYEAKHLKNLIVITVSKNDSITIVLNELQRLLSDNVFLGKIERDELSIWERLWYKEAPYPRDFRVIAFEYEFNEQVITDICKPIITQLCETC